MRSIQKALSITAAIIAICVFTAAAQQGAPQPPQAKEDKRRVFVSVDNPPSFPGGIPEFSKYLMTSIRYPADDRKNNLQGKVFVSFVVEADGSLSDVVAMRGPSETLKEEGVRVIKASPKWKPGSQNGTPVRVQYTVPINFTLGNETKKQ